jgi:hypothetical protein
MALVLMPLYFILSFVFFSPWWLAIAVFFSIPFAGLFAWSYHLFFRRITGGLRIRSYTRNKNMEYADLRRNFDELISEISKLNSL